MKTNGMTIKVSLFKKNERTRLQIQVAEMSFL